MRRGKRSLEPKPDGRPVGPAILPGSRVWDCGIYWWAAIVVVLPLVFATETFDVFGSIRYLWACIFLLCFLGYFHFYRTGEIARPRVLTRILGGLGVGFLAVLIVSSTKATNAQEALASTMQYAILPLATGLVALMALREEDRMRPLFTALALACILQSAAAIGQFYGFGLTRLVPDVPKPYGLMISRNLLASYLALLIPLCGYLVYAGNRGGKIVGGVAMGFGVYGLIIGQSRSAWIALGAGLLLSNLLVMLWRRRLEARLYKRWWRGMGLFLGGTLALLTLAVILPNREGLADSLRKRIGTLLHLTQNTPPVRAASYGVAPLSRVFGWGQRVARTIAAASAPSPLAALPTAAAEPRPKPTPDLSAQAVRGAQLGALDVPVASVNVRFYFWRKCWEMMWDNPLWGIGPGNYRVVVPRYRFYEPYPWFSSGANIFVPDRAHSVYLQTGAETGLPGFFLYLGLWLTAVGIGIQVLREAATDERRMRAVACLATVVIFAIDAQFSFPNESVAHTLMLALAVGLLVGMHEQERPPALARPKVMRLRRVYFVLPAAVLGFGAYLGHAREQFHRQLWSVAAWVAVQRYERALAETTPNPWVNMTLGGKSLEHYRALAYNGLGKWDKALEALEEEKRHNPWSIAVWSQMGRANFQLQRLDEAIRCYQEALRLAPPYAYARKSLAEAYYFKVMYKECAEVLAPCQYQDDLYYVEMLGKAYSMTQAFEKAAAVFREGLERFPGAIAILEPLAWVEYKGLQDFTRARAHFERLLELRPNDPNRETYREVLKSIAAAKP